MQQSPTRLIPFAPFFFASASSSGSAAGCDGSLLAGGGDWIEGVADALPMTVIGDIIGKPGRLAVMHTLPALRDELDERQEVPPQGRKWKVAVCGPQRPAQVYGPQ